MLSRLIVSACLDSGLIAGLKEGCYTTVHMRANGHISQAGF